MTGVERIESEDAVRCGGRRAVLAALVGGAMLTGLAKPAAAQVSSSVDTAPLQFALNLQYLTTNFLQVVTYGQGRQLPAQHIRGGELSDQPGVSATSVLQVKFPSGVRGIQSRIHEIADEHWYRTLMLRGILRADAPAQTLIDYSAETFAKMFVAAGAMASTDTLYLYTASPTDALELVRNILLAADTMVSVQASVYADAAEHDQRGDAADDGVAGGERGQQCDDDPVDAVRNGANEPGANDQGRQACGMARPDRRFGDDRRGTVAGRWHGAHRGYRCHRRLCRPDAATGAQRAVHERGFGHAGRFLSERDQRHDCAQRQSELTETR